MIRGKKKDRYVVYMNSMKNEMYRMNNEKRGTAKSEDRRYGRGYIDDSNDRLNYLYDSILNDNSSSRSYSSNNDKNYSNTNNIIKIDDYLELSHKYAKNRKDENDRLQMKRNLINQVEFIKQMRIKQYVQKEIYKNYNNIDHSKLLSNIKRFKEGLDYSLSTLNDNQIIKTLNLISSKPQAPIHFNKYHHPLINNHPKETLMTTINENDKTNNNIGNIGNKRKIEGIIMFTNMRNTIDNTINNKR